MSRFFRDSMTVCIATFLVSCVSQNQVPKDGSTQVAASSQVNDFPTQARVEYVFQCMRDHGGQNYDNLYHCSCMVDELAKRMSYQEYSEAIVFRNLRSMPGEKGGVFRDPPQAGKLRTKLQQVEREAESICFLK